MQIDWLTVAAQAVNFLILVWLLKHFLYGPVTRAMDKREAGIAERLRQAEQSRAAAEAEAATYLRQQEQLERERETLLAKAREEAQTERRTLQEQARRDVDALKADWLAQLAREQHIFARDFRLAAGEHVYRVARQALRDLADASLEQHMAKAFATELDGLDADTRATLARHCRDNGNRVEIRSRFALPAASRRRLADTVKATIAQAADIGFVTDSNLAAGIELATGGEHVRWGIGQYLDELEATAARQLSAAAGSVEAP